MSTPLTAVLSAPSSPGLSPLISSPISGGALQSRSVTVIKADDFETYKDVIKGALGYNREFFLYAVAGAIMVLAFFAIIIYLNFVIPATFVWPGVSKLFVALGLAGLGLGGMFSCAKAYECFLKAPGSQDNRSVSEIVDSYSQNVLTYQVPSEHLAPTGGLP